MITCYLNPAKSNAPRLLEAFSKGSGATITTDLTLREGVAVLYGVDAVTFPLYREILRTKTPHLVIDNGYLKARYAGGDYYRITWNSPQHTGVGESDGKRWKALGLSFKPWRAAKEGIAAQHVLLAMQSPEWYERHGTTAEEFRKKTCRAIANSTAGLLPVIVRDKPIRGIKQPPIREHLRNAWAVVTHSSNVAVDGLLEGVPCFCTFPCASSTMGLADVSRIQTPRYPDDRERWASVLADNQFTTEEMRNGMAWAALQC